MSTHPNGFNSKRFVYSGLKSFRYTTTGWATVNHVFARMKRFRSTMVSYTAILQMENS